MRFLRHLHHDTRGNVLMLTGLAILILFAVAGAGVDFGRQQLVRMKLQNASDAAAVAAASMPDSVSADQRRAVALRYYNLNFPATYLGIARPTPNIQVGSQIIVDASTSFDANFVSNVGVNRLESQGRTVVDRSAPQQTIYDVILVMDNSNSMAYNIAAPAYASTPSAERANARNLINLVCRADQINFGQRYCPGYFSGMPSPQGGTARLSYLNPQNCRNNWPTNFCDNISNSENPLNGPGVTDDGYGYSFTGNTRLNALRSVALGFVTRLIDEGESGSRIGLVAWGSSMLFNQPLSTDGTTIRRNINRMAAWGGTNPVAGMNQARTLANDFNPRHVKAVVLLTDGAPTQTGPIGSNGLDSTMCNGGNYCPPAVNQTLPICTQLKNSGVQVYTIGFLDPADGNLTASERTAGRNFLRNCASVDAEGNPRFYDAPTGAELDAAFTQILTSLGRIRIAQ